MINDGQYGIWSSSSWFQINFEKGSVFYVITYDVYDRVFL